MIKLKLTNKSCAPILMVRILSFYNKNTTKQEGIMVGKNEDDCMPINVEKVAPLFFCFVVDAFVKLTSRSLNKKITLRLRD